ncbi:uncharacterized protein CEXT_206331, partial [Caerostris extrusa]
IFCFFFLNELTSSRQSSEWQISHVTSSFSYNEVSDLTREAVDYEKKSTLESSSKTYKENIEENSECLISEEIKTLLMVDNETSDIQALNPNLSEKKSDIEIMNEVEPKTFSDFKSNSFDKHQEDIGNESSKNLNNESKEEHKVVEAKESLLKEAETSLKVSSLVRNLEKSESFQSSEKILKKEEIKSGLGQNIGHEFVSPATHLKINTNLSENNETISKADVMKENIFSNILMEKTNEISECNEDKETKIQPLPKFVKEVKLPNKLDIDSEFILKTVKRDTSLDKILDSSCKEKTGDREKPLVSSLFFEEESIMTSKSLSTEVEESGIFVSHHASYKDDLKDMVVTEAHNFAAVEENAGVFIQASEHILRDKKARICDSWISSVDIPASITQDNDVTVNSLTSTLCNNKITDEKITISVNSNSETITSIVSSHEQTDIHQKVLEPENTLLLSKPDTNNRPTLKEKQSSKLTSKSQLHEVNSNLKSVKNVNAQKRVSVEIVPFSQRMKERKYQPISFGNQEPPTEKNKKNSSATVERKLSDRKVTLKNKESDKTNNRHSFSGALISENKKGESVSEKKSATPEKVQYPVQIRIHKSIPKQEIKDKINPTTSNKGIKNSVNKDISNEVKFQVQSAKLNQNDAKLIKEEKSFQDSSAKWEVKIQPSVSHISKIPATDSDESFSSLSSEPSAPIKTECQKSPIIVNESKDLQIQQEGEPFPMKSHENWKISKELPLAIVDDPEPELLRVFARRSIKQKNCDKNKNEETQDNDASFDDSSSCGEKTEENNEISVSDNSTVIKISEISKPHIKMHDIKKKSKSFCEKEKVAARSVSPLKEMNLIHRESLIKLTSESSISSETIHPRQRLASVPDIPLSLPPDSIKNPQKESSTESSPAPSIKEEALQRTGSTPVPITAGSMNGSITSIGMVKESQEMLNDKEPHAPSWLQLAQQRRELREQRERLLLGGSPNSFMDASNKPSRSSKVWDMVNNFQKLQMT